jgi:Arc/MetJ-type ribon-helix-helix transcriptional regulator
MTITLPDGIAQRIETIAKENGYSSAAEFLISLAEDAAHDSEDANRGGPSELCPRNREELERMLDEGMNSGPPIRVTSEFWEERRRELERRMAKRGRPAT